MHHDLEQPRRPAPRAGRSLRAREEAGRGAAVLGLQRAAGNRAVGALLQRKAHWTGMKKATPNAGARDTKGTSTMRIPVEGVKEGVGRGRAIVVVPHAAATPPSTVEVFFYLHGWYIPGYGRGYHEHGGEADDEALYKIEQQIEASGRPMIGVLPQGPLSGPVRESDKAENISSYGSGGAAVNLDAYVAQAIDLAKGDWPYTPVPAPGAVVLAGHSGAGAALADMLDSSMKHDKDPKKPSLIPGRDRLESFVSFDTINGSNQYEKHRDFVVHQMDLDLDQARKQSPPVQGATEEETAAQQAAWLAKQGFRFRGIWSSGYASWYDSPKADGEKKGIKQRIDRWVKEHALPAPLEQAFRQNYTVEAAGTDHMHMIGKKLGGALKGLP